MSCGSKVVDDEFHGRGVLWNVEDRAIVGAALVLGVQCRRKRFAPRLASPVDVHVPSAFGQGLIGRLVVQRRGQAQRDGEPKIDTTTTTNNNNNNNV